MLTIAPGARPLFACSRISGVAAASRRCAPVRLVRMHRVPRRGVGLEDEGVADDRGVVDHDVDARRSARCAQFHRFPRDRPTRRYRRRPPPALGVRAATSRRAPAPSGSSRDGDARNRRSPPRRHAPPGPRRSRGRCRGRRRVTIATRLRAPRSCSGCRTRRRGSGAAPGRGAASSAVAASTITGGPAR